VAALGWLPIFLCFAPHLQQNQAGLYWAFAYSVLTFAALGMLNSLCLEAERQVNALPSDFELSVTTVMADWKALHKAEVPSPDPPYQRSSR